jgi:DNA-binding response OmpR family regulator
LAIIESDGALSAELRAAVEAAGFRAECFSTATNALTHLRTRAFALVILGLDLRDTDPYAVCEEVQPIATDHHGRRSLCSGHVRACARARRR